MYRCILHVVKYERKVYKMKKMKPYECAFLNEHLGSLKFSYPTSQSVRIENLNSLSNKNRYITRTVDNIVTVTGETYELSKWIELMKSKIKELKEEFILEELILLELNSPISNGKLTEVVQVEALKSYSYRFWESKSEGYWADFNLMLNNKYPVEMSERLINQQNRILEVDKEGVTANDTSQDNISSHGVEKSVIDLVKELPSYQAFYLEIDEDDIFEMNNF